MVIIIAPLTVWFGLCWLFRASGELRIAIINHSLKRFPVVNCGSVTGGDFPPIPGSTPSQSGLFGSSLSTSLCEIYDHKVAFLLVKTVLHKNFNLYIWKKRTDIIDLSYNIEECLAANDYFTD